MFDTIDSVLSEVKVGDGVFNVGDICNPAHHGKVTAIDHSGWGVNIWITPSPVETDEGPYCVYWTAFSGPRPRLVLA